MTRVWQLKIMCGDRVKGCAMLCETEIDYDAAYRWAVLQFGVNRVIEVRHE